ncbi:MAG: hypothetical protein DCE90_14190 [Pseudanabaena sp.]|nr:MAG: hypothetical protein DCE90_14190 [Pseudanabaena sp.]
MTVDPFNQDINVTGSSIHDSPIGAAGRDLTQNQSTIHGNQGNVTNHFNSIISFPMEMIGRVFGWFQNTLPETKQDYSRVASFEAYYSEKIVQIEQERLELEQLDYSFRAQIAERQFQLQEEIYQLEHNRFQWQKYIAEENLKTIKQSQHLALEESRRRIQIETDMHYLPLQISRDDILEIMLKESGRFIIIPSPPKNLSQEFIFNSLEEEIKYRLQDVIKRYYSSDTTAYSIGYKNILSDSIQESQAQYIGKFLAPIPNLIFNSKITHQKIFITITITCPVANFTSHDNPEISYSMASHEELLPPLNWVKLKRELELQGYSSELIDQGLLELISDVYTVVALCFSDLYCLNLNPFHTPKLFEYLKNSEFSDILDLWTQPLQIYLLDVQKKITEELNRIHQLDQIRQRYIASHHNSTNFESIQPQIIAVGIIIIFLIGMCGQQSKKADKNFITVNSTEEKINQAGRIQINSPDVNYVPLLDIPDLNGNEISRLQNGTDVVLKESSNDGEWYKVLTKDEKIGWVWHRFVVNTTRRENRLLSPKTKTDTSFLSKSRLGG